MRRAVSAVLTRQEASEAARPEATPDVPRLWAERSTAVPRRAGFRHGTHAMAVEDQAAQSLEWPSDARVRSARPEIRFLAPPPSRPRRGLSTQEARIWRRSPPRGRSRSDT